MARKLLAFGVEATLAGGVWKCEDENIQAWLNQHPKPTEYAPDKDAQMFHKFASWYGFQILEDEPPKTDWVEGRIY